VVKFIGGTRHADNEKSAATRNDILVTASDFHAMTKWNPQAAIERICARL
jgi:hypothetical protein